MRRVVPFLYVYLFWVLATSVYAVTYQNVGGVRFLGDASVIMTRSINVHTADVVLTVADHSWQVHSNEGSNLGAGNLDAQLPAAVQGAIFELESVDEDGWQVHAVGDDTIQVNGARTVAGGTVATVNTETCMSFMAIDSTQWIATTSNAHHWTIDGAHSGITALTQIHIDTPAPVNAATPIPIGGTWDDEHLEGFSRSGSELTYTGASLRHFKLILGVSAEIVAAQDTGSYSVTIYVNGAELAGSESITTFSATASVQQFMSVAVAELYTGSTIQAYIEGPDGTSNITAQTATFLVTDAGH